jgi:hypothetical protein
VIELTQDRFPVGNFRQHRNETSLTVELQEYHALWCSLVTYLLRLLVTSNISHVYLLSHVI